MKMKINEKIEIVVNKQKKSFTLYDHKFTLKLHHDSSKAKSYPMMVFLITSPSWRYPVGKVVHSIDMAGNKYWNESFEAFEDDISDGSLSRTGENIYEAAAKMLAEII